MRKKESSIVERRSDCPLSCTLDLIGDKWSLLIIRDMLVFGKTTYNEFLDSSEGISTNILNDRLVKLVETGLIQYTGPDKRKKYALTEMGADLKPIIEAFGMFGSKYFKGSKEYMKRQMAQAKNRPVKAVNR
jgi:DNA-binding HxlR family transcriptional regulator